MHRKWRDFQRECGGEQSFSSRRSHECSQANTHPGTDASRASLGPYLLDLASFG